jgi:hypothetical protein
MTMSNDSPWFAPTADWATPEGIARSEERRRKRAAITDRNSRQAETLEIMTAALNDLPGWSEPFIDKEQARELTAADKERVKNLFAEFTTWCAKNHIHQSIPASGPALATFAIERAAEGGLPAAEAALDAVKLMHFAARLDDDPTADQHVRKALRFLNDLQERFENETHNEA